MFRSTFITAGRRAPREGHAITMPRKIMKKSVNRSAEHFELSHVFQGASTLPGYEALNVTELETRSTRKYFQAILRTAAITAESSKNRSPRVVTLISQRGTRLKPCCARLYDRKCSGCEALRPRMPMGGRIIAATRVTVVVPRQFS